MNGWGWAAVVAAVVIVAVLVLLAVRARQRDRRREELRARFGPEYDRVVSQADDRDAAESRLAELAHTRDTLDLRDLDPAERARLDERWDLVQSQFVDEPGRAVGGADALVTRVMRERGYPTDEDGEPSDGHGAVDDRAALLATDHPDVVSGYRAARDAFDRHRASGRADTEDLRRAFVGYRALYEALTGPAAGPGARHGRHVREAERAEWAERAERADLAPGRRA